jgi:predicted nucleic acid-binding protein
MIVDASVIAAALVDGQPLGRSARAAIRGNSLIAPACIGLEVVSAWRRKVRLGELDPQIAAVAIDDLTRAPITLMPHGPLLKRIWQLRDNLSTYGASYVALAESLAMPLLTADRRLANAPGAACEFRVLD